MKLILGVVAIFVLAVVTVALFAVYLCLPEAEQPNLLLEIARTLLQLSVIAIIGGAFKWMYDEVAQERRQQEKEKVREAEQLAAINKLRSELLQELQSAGLETITALKETTKILAKQEQNAFGLHQSVIQIWQTLMTALVRFSYELDSAPGLFAHQTQVLARIQAITASIDSLFDEYLSIDKPGLRSLGAEQWPDCVPVYADFHNNLDERFVKPWHQALALMREDVLGTRVTAD